VRGFLVLEVEPNESVGARNRIARLRRTLIIGGGRDDQARCGCEKVGGIGGIIRMKPVQAGTMHGRSPDAASYQ